MYEVNLRKPMGSITVLRKTRSAEWVLVRACFFLFSISGIVAPLFPLCLVKFIKTIVITVLNCIVFLLN